MFGEWHKAQNTPWLVLLPFVVNDRYVFIRQNAALSSIGLLLFAFSSHYVRDGRILQDHHSFLPSTFWQLTGMFLEWTWKIYGDLWCKPQSVPTKIWCHFSLLLSLPSFTSFKPLQWCVLHLTTYSNLSLIKISAELWSPCWYSALKWSSLVKNWKPFHLRGLKGSKEHQITLPVVFLFFFFFFLRSL